MFVRKDPFKGRRRTQMKEDTILEMEDYCSILLYARYVREADGDLSKLNTNLYRSFDAVEWLLCQKKFVKSLTRYSKRS